MCRPIIKFSQAVYIIDPGFHLVLAGYQPAWAMWYISLMPQALVLCLIYTHKPEGRRPEGLCVYIRQSARACGISITWKLQQYQLFNIFLQQESVCVMASLLCQYPIPCSFGVLKSIVVIIKLNFPLAPVVVALLSSYCCNFEAIHWAQNVHIQLLLFWYYFNSSTWLSSLYNAKSV